MGTYRLYCLDGVDKVASAEWIEAEDDEAAVEVAEDMRGGRTCELWQHDRLVARIGARQQDLRGPPPRQSGPQGEDPPHA